jgi:hypothetical protein
MTDFSSIPGGAGVLAGLPYGAGVTSRQISGENPTGEKGAGCTWDPNPDDPDLPFSGAARDLGRGWKVRPFIKVLAGTTVTLADIEGPGCINKIWFTSNLPHWRALILRIYWDDEETPSVEVPAGDFFAMGHDSAPHLVQSEPVAVNPYRACNCYWSMPFRRRARITLENEGKVDANVVAYAVNYKLYPIAEDAAYFHAQWRRTITTRELPEHTILDGVKGEGLYVGTYIAWAAFSNGWWGEGEVKFFLDGDGEFPTIIDGGTEDYFGGAWCFWSKGVRDDPEQTYNTPYLGLPLAQIDNHKGARLYSLYRWHVHDSIGFASDLKVTVQTLSWYPDRTYQPATDDLASVAYWYQREPHAPYPRMVPLRDRWGR